MSHLRYAYSIHMDLSRFGPFFGVKKGKALISSQPSKLWNLFSSPFNLAEMLLNREQYVHHRNIIVVLTRDSFEHNCCSHMQFIHRVQVCVPKGTKDIYLVVMAQRPFMSNNHLSTHTQTSIDLYRTSSSSFSSLIGCCTQCGSTQTWPGHAGFVSLLRT